MLNVLSDIITNSSRSTSQVKQSQPQNYLLKNISLQELYIRNSGNDNQSDMEKRHTHVEYDNLVKSVKTPA